MIKMNLQLFAQAGVSKAVSDALLKTVQKNAENTVKNIADKAKPKNTTYTPSTVSYSTGGLKGVDQSLINKINSNYSTSDKVLSAQTSAEKQLQKVQEIANKTDIIDQKTWDRLNSTFKASTAYTEAMKYTNDLLKQISTGRTSYTDQIKELMGEIQNRPDFEYDVDSDPLFQQALSSAMSSGMTAMQDTVGQASALTGGYGSSYATSAGNQQYNAFIEDAYNNLPEYYQMAMQAYQMEGDDMYNQLAMLNTADSTEFQRMYDSWNANFANSQNMYSQEYGAWQDSVSNAYNSANLQLSEHSQLFDQAYSTYGAMQNMADTLYGQEYQAWADQVSNAFNLANMQNSDWWNTTNYNASQRKYSTSTNNNSTTTKNTDKEAELKEPSETQMQKALEAYSSGGTKALNQYLNSLPSTVNKDLAAEYAASYGKYDSYNDKNNQVGLNERTYTMTDDTINGFLGMGAWTRDYDPDDVVTDHYGNSYTLKEWADMGLSEDILKQLSKLEDDEQWSGKKK